MQKAIMLVLAGVAIGLLVAPDKGSATQKKVSDWLGGKADEAKDAIEDAGNNLKSKALSVKTDLKEVKNDIQNEAHDKVRSF